MDNGPAHTKLNVYVIVAASIAAVSGILFGFDTGVISGAILFIRDQFHLSDFMNGVIVSAVLLGALLGSLVSGWFVDFFGRRRLLIITALVFFVGTLGSSLSQTITTIYMSRLVVGFAIGIASFAAPLYISEISPARYRGALVTLNQLAITLGILLAYIVDIIYSKQAEGWRWMFAMGMIPAIILFFGMFYLPRSPRWLIFKGLDREAMDTLRKIRGKNYSDTELHDIKASVKEKGSIAMLFQKWLLPSIIIGLGLGFLQQCTGINTIIYYAPTIFQLAGIKSATGAILATTGVGVVNVLFTIVALPLIDRWGRRPLLITGLIGMLLSLLMLTLSFAFGAHQIYLKWLALGSMVIYIACFAISLGPIMWLLIAEIFPLEIRGFASSLMVASSWFFNGIVALTFLTLIKHFGESGTFSIYAFISFLGILFVIFRVPETKGTTLEQIENNLRAGVKSVNLGRADVTER